MKKSYSVIRLTIQDLSAGLRQLIGIKILTCSLYCQTSLYHLKNGQNTNRIPIRLDIFLVRA